METPISALCEEVKFAESLKPQTAEIPTPQYSCSDLLPLIRDCKVEIRNLTLSEISRISINPFTISVRCKFCSKPVVEGPRCMRKCKSYYHKECALRKVVCCEASIIPNSRFVQHICPECRRDVQFGPKCTSCTQTFHVNCVTQFTTCCGKFLETRKSKEIGCSECYLPVRLATCCPSCSRRYHYGCIKGSFPCCHNIRVNLDTVLCYCADCGKRISLPGVVCTICWNLYHRKCIQTNRKCCGHDLGDVLFSPRLDIVKMGGNGPNRPKPSTSAATDPLSFSPPKKSLVLQPEPSKKIVRTVKLTNVKKPLVPAVDIQYEEIKDPYCADGKGPQKMIVVKRKAANGTIICSKGVILKPVKKNENGQPDLNTLKGLLANKPRVHAKTVLPSAFATNNKKAKNDPSSNGTNVLKKQQNAKSSATNNKSPQQKSPRKKQPLSDRKRTASSTNVFDLPNAEVPVPPLHFLNVSNNSIKSEVPEETDPLAIDDPVIQIDDDDEEMAPPFTMKQCADVRSNMESGSSLLNNEVGSSSDKDGLKDFFSLLYDTVKLFPPAIQAQLKFKLFKTVSEAELELHNQK